MQATRRQFSSTAFDGLRTETPVWKVYRFISCFLKDEVLSSRMPILEDSFHPQLLNNEQEPGSELALSSIPGSHCSFPNRVSPLQLSLDWGSCVFGLIAFIVYASLRMTAQSNGSFGCLTKEKKCVCFLYAQWPLTVILESLMNP